MAIPNLLELAVAQLRQFATNFQRNLFHMFDDMNATRYIRLIACVGAYLLLRPYFVKLGEKITSKNLEKISGEKPRDPYEASGGGKGKGSISPNFLRGGGKAGGKKSVSFSVEGDVDVDEGKSSGANWGKKARERQRKVVSALAENRERVLVEDDEAEAEAEVDVMNLLVDYEEGEDGW